MNAVLAPLAVGTMPAQRTPAMSLDAFVRTTRTTISDVVLAASGDMHRVELALDGKARFTVTAPRDHTCDGVARAEAEALARLSRTLSPTVARTVPTCVDVVEVGGRRCLVLTALSGEVLRPVTVPSSLAWDPVIDEQFQSVLRWLQELWACTCASEPAVVDSTLVPTLAARLGHDPRWPRVEAVVAAATQRLAATPVPSTAVHGALSPHAIRLDGARVAGVGDWSQARLPGDARADVARFVVAYAPDHVGTALHARTRYASAVRSFVTGALRSLGADPATWRETVVVGLAEAAATGEPALADDAARELWALSRGTSWTAAPLRGRSSS